MGEEWGDKECVSKEIQNRVVVVFSCEEKGEGEGGGKAQVVGWIRRQRFIITARELHGRAALPAASEGGGETEL